MVTFENKVYEIGERRSGSQAYMQLENKETKRKKYERKNSGK
jgi:hypothetical protein